MTKKSHVVLIDQARMGATRLPGKVLKEVLGKPLLAYQIERLKQSTFIDTIVIATTTNPQDDVIADSAFKNHVDVFRGSEEDVLNRYAETASQFNADVVVRITSDCPIIDPQVIDNCIQLFLEHPELDYVSNTIDRTFPRGMDVEVFSRKALDISEKQAKRIPEREHVTPYIYQHLDLFKIAHFKNAEDLSHYRITVDTPEDFELLKRIIETLYPTDPHFNLDSIIELLTKHPDWITLNAEIKQKIDHLL